MGIDIRVYDTDAPWSETSYVGTLSEDFARNLHAQRNDVGSWAFGLLADAADLALLIIDYWVKFRIEGQIVFSGRVGKWDEATVVAGEEAEEIVAFSAPGALATLKDAVVYPHPAGRLVSDTRFFNFASPDYTSTVEYASWTAAVELFQQGDAINSLYGVDAPENWPDPTAYWIWSRDIDLGLDPPMPVGVTYYRTTVMTSQGDHSLFIAADDGYELWVDGVLQAAQTEAFQWRVTRKVDVFLEDGVHDIAIKATNIQRTSSATNGAGVVFAMYSTTNGGELDVLKLHSDSTWDALDYPATVPGFTVGELLDVLFEEAWARDALMVWGLWTDGVEDTEGNAWAERVEIAFRVGEPYLDVLRKLAETFVDFDADYEGINLMVWNKDGRPNGSAVAFATGDDLEDYHRSQDPNYVTDLLVHQADGKYTEQASGFGVGGTGGDDPRKEAMIEAGSAPSDGSAARLAEGALEQFAVPAVAATWKAVPSLGQFPLIDWWPGKTITLDGQNTLVRAVVVTDRSPDEDGFVDGSYDATGEGIET